MSPTSHNILLVSNASDAKRVRGALLGSTDGPFTVEWVRSRAEAVDRLAAHSHGQAPRAGVPDSVVAVLVDLFLPDSSGIDTVVQLLRAAPQIPILILSAAQHEDIARQAVSQGALDYFLKNHLDRMDPGRGGGTSD